MVAAVIGLAGTSLHTSRVADGARDPADLYHAYAGRLLGWFRAERVAEPEDLVAEVFLQVARDLPRFRGDDAALRRWVFSIGYNRMLDERRRHQRRPQLADAPPPEEPLEDPEPLDPELEAALEALTPDQREVVVLRFVADLSLEETARVTGRRVGAVKSLQHRALRNLAEAVSPER